MFESAYRPADIVGDKGSACWRSVNLALGLGLEEGDGLSLGRLVQSDDLEEEIGAGRPDATDDVRRILDLVGGKGGERMRGGEFGGDDLWHR